MLPKLCLFKKRRKWNPRQFCFNFQAISTYLLIPSQERSICVSEPAIFLRITWHWHRESVEESKLKELAWTSAGVTAKIWDWFIWVSSALNFSSQCVGLFQPPVLPYIGQLKLWVMNPCFQQWVFSFMPFSSTLLLFDHSVHLCVLALPLLFVTRSKLKDPPMRLRSGHGPTSPRGDLHQCTQCVKASCLNPVSAVTGLMMWQGRSGNAVDILPVVGNG